METLRPVGWLLTWPRNTGATRAVIDQAEKVAWHYRASVPWALVALAVFLAGNSVIFTATWVRHVEALLLEKIGTHP